MTNSAIPSANNNNNNDNLVPFEKTFMVIMEVASSDLSNRRLTDGQKGDSMGGLGRMVGQWQHQEIEKKRNIQNYEYGV